jgi:hypothetical protein
MLPTANMKMVRRLRPLAALGPARTTPNPRRSFHSKSAVQSTAEAAPQQQDASFEKQSSPSPFDAINARRAKAGRLLAGVAAASDADMFKAPVRLPLMVPLSQPRENPPLTRSHQVIQ